MEVLEERRQLPRLPLHRHAASRPLYPQPRRQEPVRDRGDRTPPGRLTKSSATRSAGAGPLEYGINHPGGVNVPHNSTDWYTRFGYAAGKVPMTDTEWTNYSSTPLLLGGRAEGCPGVPEATWAEKGMGLTAWTLTPGVLAASADLADPTVIKSDWACTEHRTGRRGRCADHELVQAAQLPWTRAPGTSAPDTSGDSGRLSCENM